MEILKSVPIGKTVIVRKFHLDEATALRLQALGMIIGTKITVLAEKGKGTMIIDLRGTRFALGAAITKNIEVEAANE